MAPNRPKFFINIYVERRRRMHWRPWPMSELFQIRCVNHYFGVLCIASHYNEIQYAHFESSLSVACCCLSLDCIGTPRVIATGPFVAVFWLFCPLQRDLTDLKSSDRRYSDHSPTPLNLR